MIMYGKRGVLKKIMDLNLNPEVYIMQVEDNMVEFNGNKRPVITIKGWYSQVRWKDQSTYWVSL